MARLPVKELYTPPTTNKTFWGKYGVLPDEQPKTSTWYYVKSLRFGVNASTRATVDAAVFFRSSF